MSQVVVRVSGRDELIRALQERSDAVLKAAQEGLYQAGLAIAAKAQDNCTPGTTPYWKAPLETGALRSRIKAEETPKVTEDGEIHSEVTCNISYAEPVHEGHFTRHSRSSFAGASRYSLGSESRSYVPGRPFLLDAMNAKKEDTLKTVAGQIKAVLE